MRARARGRRGPCNGRVVRSSVRRVISMRTLTSRGATRSAHPDIHSWTRTGAPTDFAFPASIAVVPGTGPAETGITLEVELGLSPRAPGQPTLTAATGMACAPRTATTVLRRRVMDGSIRAETAGIASPFRRQAVEGLRGSPARAGGGARVSTVIRSSRDSPGSGARPRTQPDAPGHGAVPWTIRPATSHRRRRYGRGVSRATCG